MSTIILIVVLAAVGGAIWYYFETQATKDVVRTTLPPAQIIRQAVQEIGSQRRYAATGHSTDFASFTFKQHANCLIAIILTFFFIVPGILYFFLASRTQSLSINVFPEPDGTTSVQVSSSGGETKRRGKRFLRGLPTLPALSAQQAPRIPVTPTMPATTTPLESPSTSSLTSSETRPETSAAAPQPSLASGAFEARAASNAASQATVFCQDCGASVGPENRFCPSCGKEQPVAS